MALRNKVTIGNEYVPRPPEYSSLEVGQLFRYACPWDENNVYMKTNNPDYCLHLNTGILFTVKPDRQVSLVHVHVTLNSYS